MPSFILVTGLPQADTSVFAADLWRLSNPIIRNLPRLLFHCLSFGTIPFPQTYYGPGGDSGVQRVKCSSARAPSCGGRLAVRTAVASELPVSLDLNRTLTEAVGVEQQVSGLGLDLLPVCPTRGRELQMH